MKTTSISVMAGALMALAVGCHTADTRPAVFQAGFGSVELKPPMGLSLSGYFEKRPCAGELDPVEAKCVAFTDGVETSLVFSVDLEQIKGTRLCAEYRAGIAAAAGVRSDSIVIACTHTHTGPTIGPEADSPEIGFDGDPAYDRLLGEKLAAAGLAAVRDLAPATLAFARDQVKGLSFIRRYRLKDGTVKTNPGYGSRPKVKGPLGEADHQLQLVRIDRVGRDSIALVNFQTHPDVIGGCKASADWPGFLRRGLERRVRGVRCLFLNGAQGDTNHIDIDDRSKRGYEHSRKMGETLAEAAAKLWPKCRPMAAGRVSARIDRTKVRLRQPSPEEVAKVDKLNRVKRNRIRRIREMSAEMTVPVTTMAIGTSLAFAGLPVEPFTKIGRRVKEDSPYRVTFFACIANGDLGYLPNADAYDEGAYETDSSIFEPGTDDTLVTAALASLYAMYPAAPREVPELFSAGTDRNRWEREVRPAHVKTLLEMEYGVRPVERPADLAFAETAPVETCFGGKAIRKRVRATYSGPRGKSHFDFSVWIPTVRKRSPVFIHSSPRPAESAADPKGPRPVYLLPAERIVDRGYAVVAYCNQEVALDWNLTPTEPTNGVFAAFGPKNLNERSHREWGILSAWAWGMSRILDWVETEPLLDAKRAAAVGLSRNGKTALVAGAFDERFALTVSCCSGMGGAKLNHVELPKSEHLRQIAIAKTWFSPEFTKWIDRECEIGFDQHWLLALVAPRLLYVSSALEDSWAGQFGEFSAARFASPAWELYGRRGLVAPGGFPPPDAPLAAGSVGYHFRHGPHAILEYDWDRYLDFADRHGWNR